MTLTPHEKENVCSLNGTLRDRVVYEREVQKLVASQKRFDAKVQEMKGLFEDVKAERAALDRDQAYFWELVIS